MRPFLPRYLPLHAKMFIFAAIVLVVLALVASINMVVEGERLLDYTAEKEFEQFKRVYSSEREVRENDLGLAIDLLLADPAIREAMAEGDRESLLNRCRPLYETSLHPRYGIDQFHFQDSLSRSLLRVHRPDLFGDDLSDHRNMVVRTNEVRSQQRGIEIGAGGLGLRVVVPVFFNGRHVGNVELGTSLATLLGAAGKATDIEFAVALSDSALGRVPLFRADLPRLAESGLRLASISDPNLANIASNIPKTDAHARYRMEDRWFVSDSLPLSDYSGEEIGKILLFRDATLLHENVYSSVYRKIIAVVLLAAAMAIVVYFVIGNSFVQPFLDVLGLSERISRGETCVEIDDGKAGGEVGLLMGNLQRMATNLDHLKTEHRLSEDIKLKLGNAMAQVSEGIVMTDLDGAITYVNPAFEKITGYSSADLLEQNPRILKSGVQDDDFYRAMWEELSSGRAWSGEFVNRRKDGSVYYEQAFISPIREADGTPSGYMAIKSDVTDIKKLEAQLRQAQKMEALGTLAGGIAHDFNNILTAVIGYTQLLEMDLPEDASEQEAVREILQATDRARGLVHQILTFARKGEQRKIPLKIAPAVEEALRMLTVSLPASMRIVADVKSDAVVSSNPNWIHQIVLNLCTNAVQAMNHNGTLTLRLRNEKRGSGDGREGTDWVILDVEDTGPGIPPNLQERIFEPFFTTKPSGKGTGLGLSVVDGIVRECGGSIVVISERGRGSIFRVRLPVSSSSSMRGPAVDRGRHAGGRGHILFVDDERALVDLARTMLPKFGYEVSAFTDARQALEQFRASPESYEVLVTDLDMPGMGGDALIGEIRAIRPSLPTILCTGQGKRNLEETVKEHGVKVTLLKPMTMADVATAVTRLLSQSTPGRSTDLH